ncbi:hypothetical protein A2U01_0090397, partial [Trifolium medium]|nr:hypothetical protein [Trifolium medium]
KIDVMQESGVVVVDGARRRLNTDEAFASAVCARRASLCALRRRGI